MNLDPAPGDTRGEPQLLYVNFNQDNTCICVGTTVGYQLISLASVDTHLEVLFNSLNKEGNNKEETYLIERLFSSSLVAIVTQSQKRKLKLCHFKKATEICSYNYSDTILALKLNRQRLLVVLEKSLYVHNIRDMKVLHTIRDTPPNKNGVCALSVDNDKNYIAYPGSSQNGEVQVFDAINLKAVAVIAAHDSQIAAMSFSPSGEKLATASEKGTIVRVFSIPEGNKLFEFQRGVTRSVTIHSLAFGYEEMFLAASSNTETIHIFKLTEQSSEPASEEQPSGWMSYVGKAIMTSASYLPSNVSDVLSRSRDFTQAKLECSGLKNVCAITMNSHKVPLLLVITADGKLTVFSFDPKDSKDCKLLKSHSILNIPSTETMAMSSTQQAGLYGTSQGSLLHQPPPTTTPGLSSNSPGGSSQLVPHHSDDDPPNTYSTKT